MKNELIRRHGVSIGLMEFLVCAVLVVIKFDLKMIFDRLVDKFDIEEQRLILRLVPLSEGMDMLDVGAEVLI